MIADVGIDDLVADDHAHQEPQAIAHQEDEADARAPVPKVDLLVDEFLLAPDLDVARQHLREAGLDFAGLRRVAELHHAQIDHAQRVSAGHAIGAVADEVPLAEDDVSVGCEVGAHFERPHHADGLAVQLRASLPEDFFSGTEHLVLLFLAPHVE